MKLPKGKYFDEKSLVDQEEDYEIMLLQMVKQFLEGKILYEKIGEFLLMDFLNNIRYSPQMSPDKF